MLSKGIITERRHRRREGRQVTVLIPKSIMRKAMRSVVPCKTFVGVKGNVDNLIRVSRVDRGQVSSIRRILGRKRGMGTGVLGAGSKGIDLDVGTLRSVVRGPRRRRRTRTVRCDSGRATKADLKSLLSEFGLWSGFL